MKTSTTLLIATGAVLTVIGVSSAVNADSGRCDRSFENGCSDRYQQMHGPERHGGMGPMGPQFGRPMGPMMGPPMFAGGLMGPMIMKRAFELADTDRDGKLTEAEIDAARTERFETHDVNGDGKLTLDEFDSLLRELTQPVTVRAFQFLDPDGDAVITKEEFDRPTSRLMGFLDRNGDGALSADDRPDSFHGGFHHGRYDEEKDDN